MALKRTAFWLLLITALTPRGLAQSRITYADTTDPIIDWQTDMQWVGPEIVYGYGERFDLQVNTGTIDSVDFVVDGLGSDSIILELMKDTIVDYVGVYESVPDLTSNPFLKITIYNESIKLGSRTHIALPRAVVPDSFFVVLINDSNVVNEYRSYQTQPENLGVFRSVFLSVDTQYGSGDFAAYLNRAFSDSNNNPLYAEMDIGVTYESSEGVQMHLSSSPVSIEVYPNPAPSGNPIRLSGDGSMVYAEVLDDAGRIVRNYRINENLPITEIPTQGLAAGMYNAILFHSDGNSTSVKFVVE